ncbi:MAG: hypothetical protein JNL32_09920, partial [Candidatus Kapabacteria bacterium]|nr:hypothetical protein [Candidatus Kapabacteria bacterium]
VDAFRAGMQVVFTGLRVNTAMEVIEGEMTGKVATNSPVDQSFANTLQQNTRMTRMQIDAVHNLASDATRLVSGFAGFQPMTLPIGIDRTIEGQRIVIGVMGMVFRPTSARMNVVLSFPMPYFGEGERIGFAARDVCFSNSGIGRQFQIGLYDDLGFNLGQRRWAFHFLAPKDGDPGTYAQFGCEGFEHIRVKARLEFDRECLVPAPDPDSTRRVKLDFTTMIRADGNFVAFATMDKWSPASLRDFTAQTDTLGIDFSEKENIPGMQFPDGYQGIRTVMWRGFYFKRLQLKMPDVCRTFDNRNPELTVTRMLIDRTGLSMTASATSVIQHPQGNFSGWGASVDSVYLSILSNNLQRGDMFGRISVPVFSQPLNYSATYAKQPDGTRDFELGIRPQADLTAPLWIANFTLHQTSSIGIRYSTASDTRRLPDGTIDRRAAGFSAFARLNGMLSVQGSTPVSSTSQQMTGMDFRGIRFQNFYLSTDRNRMVETGTWSLASPQHGFAAVTTPDPEPDPTPQAASPQQSKNGSASGFPISLDSIRFVTGTTSENLPRIGLQFHAKVNLMPERQGTSSSSGGINALSGSTTLSLWGALRGGTTEAMNAAYDGVQLDAIAIDFDAGAVRARGRVNFYNNDNTYGTGFRGEVNATFAKLVEIRSVVQFGSKPVSAGSATTFRYWYVDALATWDKGFPVPGVPGVGIYGFGGGAWYNMVSDTSAAGAARLRSATTPTPVSTMRTQAQMQGAPIGSTNSSATYTPSYSASGETLGFFAQMTLGTFPSPEAFNTDLKIGMSFAGGVPRNIFLEGEGFFFSKPTQRQSNARRLTISTRFMFEFGDVPTFTGNVDVRFQQEPVTAWGGVRMLFIRLHRCYVVCS